MKRVPENIASHLQLAIGFIGMGDMEKIHYHKLVRFYEHKREWSQKYTLEDKQLKSFCFVFL